MGVNRALLKMARHQTAGYGAEKRGFQLPGGAAQDPSQGGGAAPPDPSGGMGAAPPGMDPSMAGGAAPPMGAAPPAAPPGMAPAPAMPGQQPMGQPAQQKMKPEQMMQMLDFRLYNMQQQVTAMLNHLGIQVPAGALVMPPGQMSPTPEAAMQGGPQDPSTQPGAPGAGGGQGSAISPIEPMQGASPELAAGGGGGGGGGGGEKSGGWKSYGIIGDATKLPNHFMRKQELATFLKDANAQAPVGYRVLLQKQSAADVSSTEGNVDEEGPQGAPPSQALNVPGAPGCRPADAAGPTAGGSKDPLSVTDGEMPAPKAASLQFAESLAAGERSASYMGDPVPRDVATPYTANLWQPDPKPAAGSVPKTAAAVAAMLRSRTRSGNA